MSTREQKELLALRIIYMLIIWLLLRLASWAIVIVGLINYIWRWTNSGQGNDVLNLWGNRLGNWMQTATKYLTSANEEKPWPFRDWQDD